MKNNEINENSKVRNIKLIISYDGTNFFGWQRQPKGRTVQGEIESALEKIHHHPVLISGSGRTDSGVHARGQVANFFTDIETIPAQNFLIALNSILPRDIRIMNSVEVENNFHSRFDAKSRTYRYFIHCGVTPLATDLPYVWSIRRYPDIILLNDMASCLKGEIDCTTFASPKDASPTRSRYIYNAFFYFESPERLVFEITANAFLWRMVRSITGSLIEFEEKKLSVDDFSKIIKSCDRSKAGQTAPSNGLFLWDIKY